jgi:hypothetical protein
MPDWIFYCWKCNNPTDMIDKIVRNDTCPHCGIDMRTCKNCTFYDPGAHNQCRESVAIYQPDKERGNFCTMFTPFEGEHDKGEDIDLAKARLNALFKK